MVKNTKNTEFPGPSSCMILYMIWDHPSPVNMMKTVKIACGKSLKLMRSSAGRFRPYSCNPPTANTNSIKNARLTTPLRGPRELKMEATIFRRDAKRVVLATKLATRKKRAAEAPGKSSQMSTTVATTTSASKRLKLESKYLKPCAVKRRMSSIKNTRLQRSVICSPTAKMYLGSPGGIAPSSLENTRSFAPRTQPPSKVKSPSGTKNAVAATATLVALVLFASASVAVLFARAVKVAVEVSAADSISDAS
mmetsp:Transcript_71120/g.143155  ORF Transcript_71120/g.143155 Transcript_71120/m.143155 type:complete len:251 (-) Transcript_71120:1107-1859(-)